MIKPMTMAKQLFLFDVDDTIADSGRRISAEMVALFNSMPSDIEIGIVGGGMYNKIADQVRHHPKITRVFSECGCVYHRRQKNGIMEEMYRKDVREHVDYICIQSVIKTALRFLSDVSYPLAGHMIDVRSGIVYISLVGLNATDAERAIYFAVDHKHGIRQALLKILGDKLAEEGMLNRIAVVEGGSVGIAVYPAEYDKVQIMQSLNVGAYKKIVYFGDKYKKNGNDVALLAHPAVVGIKVDCPDDTMRELRQLLVETDINIV